MERNIPKNHTAVFFRGARKTLRMTQEQLAELLDTPRYNIAKYENGITTPSGNTILKVMELLERNVQL